MLDKNLEDLKIAMGPAYIFDDGTIFVLPEHGYHTHFAYERKQRIKPSQKGPRRTIVNLNHWIRINDRPGEVLVELPIIEPTSTQYDSIEQFLNSLLDSGIYKVEIGIEPDGSIIRYWSSTVMFYNKFDLLELKPEYIIQRIKNHYNQNK